MIFDCRGREGLIVDPDLGEPALVLTTNCSRRFRIALPMICSENPSR